MLTEQTTLGKSRINFLNDFSESLPLGGFLVYRRGNMFLVITRILYIKLESTTSKWYCI